MNESPKNESPLKCADFEILLADYLDKTLPADELHFVESHRVACISCRDLARDAAQAMTLLTSAPAIDPPPFLVQQILRTTSEHTGPSRSFSSWSVSSLTFSSLSLFFARVVKRFNIAGLLQPRFAMGLAMAALSLVMIGRFWFAAENNAYRAWNRTMKRYENLAVVYDVQNQLDEWRAQNGAGPIGTRK